MAKKQRRKSVDRENLSPLEKLKLNQQIKSTELMLSSDELEAFRKLSQAEKRDVVQEVLRNKVNEAIDAEIIDYFKQLNATRWGFVTSPTPLQPIKLWISSKGLLYL